MTLTGKRVLMGVSGGIAAYKAVEVVRELQRTGAEVRVVMSQAATRFVGPITFAGITGRPPVVDLWDPSYPGEVHVELGEWAELILIAPATAGLMARAAAGMADDALLATLLCSDCPRFFAPAMHERMWRAPATQRNLDQLRQDGVQFIGPVQGPLANGREGWGRMADPKAIVQTLLDAVLIRAAEDSPQDLAGRTIVISAGPTAEDLDPVRFISNRSSGRMGFALASRARARGARVILVSGPVALATPPGVERIDVRNALDMRAAVRAQVGGADAVIMTAAVADYRPAQTREAKLKKTGETLTLELVRNPDILAELGQEREGPRPVLVGFAMETDHVVQYARRKLEAKRLDLVVANEAAVGFGRDDTQVTLVSPRGDEALPPMSKARAADIILDRISAQLR